MTQLENTNQEIQAFNFAGMTLRALLINNEPWFVAQDVSKMLGYSESYAMTRRLDDDETSTADLAGQVQTRKFVLINEPGLYSAILGSRVEGAKAFKKWVTKEVLPTIRKTGSYSVEKKPETKLEWMQLAVETEKARLELEARNKELEPKALTHDKVLDKGSSLGFRQLAATIRDDYPDMNENELKELMREHGLIQKRSVSSTAKARTEGYALDVVSGTFGNKTRTQTRWTPDGIGYIIHLIENN